MKVTSLGSGEVAGDMKVVKGEEMRTKAEGDFTVQKSSIEEETS